MGYSPWGLKESDTTEWLTQTDRQTDRQTHTHTCDSHDLGWTSRVLKWEEFRFGIRKSWVQGLFLCHPEQCVSVASPVIIQSQRVVGSLDWITNLKPRCPWLSVPTSFSLIAHFLTSGCAEPLRLLRAGVAPWCWAQASRGAGFSCCGAAAPGERASGSAARGLGTQAHKLSRCDAWVQLLYCTGNLPRPGIEPLSPAPAGGFLPTAPPGMSVHGPSHSVMSSSLEPYGL